MAAHQYPSEEGVFSKVIGYRFIMTKISEDDQFNINPNQNTKFVLQTTSKYPHMKEDCQCSTLM